MNLRPLTHAELVIIWEVKQLANTVLKLQRQALAEKIKKRQQFLAKERQQARAKGVKQVPRYTDKVEFDLQQAYDALKLITGKPVVIRQNGEALRLNYELFQKLYHSLEKRRWPCEVRVKGGLTNATLTIQYPRGIIELNELPAYQLKLLGALPVVDLEYGFDFLN